MNAAVGDYRPAATSEVKLKRGGEPAGIDLIENPDLLKSLKADIGEAVTLNRRSRIYVILNQDGRTRGRYLVGKRKSPPWTGYGDVFDQELDED